MIQTRRAATLWWALLVMWAGVIFVLSAQNHLVISPDPLIDWVLRKCAHAIVFGLFAGLALLAFRTSGLRRPALWAIVLATAYAASDEFHQAFVNGRNPAVVDVLIDIAGAAALVLVISRRIQGTRRTSAN